MGCSSSVPSIPDETDGGGAGEGVEAGTGGADVLVDALRKSTPVSNRLNDVQEEEEEEKTSTKKDVAKADVDQVPLLNDVLNDSASAKSRNSSKSASSTRSLGSKHSRLQNSAKSKSTRLTSSAGSNKSAPGSLSAAEVTLPGMVQTVDDDEPEEKSKNQEVSTGGMNSRPSSSNKDSLKAEVKAEEQKYDNMQEVTSNQNKGIEYKEAPATTTTQEKDADSSLKDESGYQGKREAPDGDEGNHEITEDKTATALSDADKVNTSAVEVPIQRKESAGSHRDTADVRDGGESVVASTKVSKRSAKSVAVSISDLLSDSDLVSADSQSSVRIKSGSGVSVKKESTSPTYKPTHDKAPMSPIEVVASPANVEAAPLKDETSSIKSAANNLVETTDNGVQLQPEENVSTSEVQDSSTTQVSMSSADEALPEKEEKLDNTNEEVKGIVDQSTTDETEMPDNDKQSVNSPDTASNSATIKEEDSNDLSSEVTDKENPVITDATSDSIQLKEEASPKPTSPRIEEHSDTKSSSHNEDLTVTETKHTDSMSVSNTEMEGLVEASNDVQENSEQRVDSGDTTEETFDGQDIGTKNETSSVTNENAKNEEDKTTEERTSQGEDSLNSELKESPKVNKNTLASETLSNSKDEDLAGSDDSSGSNVSSTETQPAEIKANSDRTQDTIDTREIIAIEIIRGSLSGSPDQIAETPIREFSTTITESFASITEDSASIKADARSIRGFS